MGGGMPDACKDFPGKFPELNVAKVVEWGELLEGELESCTNNWLLQITPVEVGDFRADHVPGHSRGSVFYSNAELSVVFTGETWQKTFHNSSEVWLLQYAAILLVILYIPFVRVVTQFTYGQPWLRHSRFEVNLLIFHLLRAGHQGQFGVLVRKTYSFPCILSLWPCSVISFIARVCSKSLSQTSSSRPWTSNVTWTLKVLQKIGLKQM